ncbi:MAG: single-stranded DNA-binding protein [Opitutales bacterium]
MASLNKVLMMGNLTRDPEVRTLPSGVAVCDFRIAVSRSYTDREGNRREETAYVDVSSFGKQAETISKYMVKGRPIFVEGRLKLDEWEKDGEKRSKLKIILENFQFVGGGDGAPSSGSGSESSNLTPTPPPEDKSATPPQDPPTSSPSSETEVQADSVEEDDVPF